VTIIEARSLRSEMTWKTSSAQRQVAELIQHGKLGAHLAGHHAGELPAALGFL
jgi:hypothetical protein